MVNLKRNIYAISLLAALYVSPVYCECSKGEPVESNEDSFRRKTLFGGPESSEVFLNYIEERQNNLTPSYVFPAFDRAMKPWFDFKRRLEKEKNFRIGGHYQILAQKANRVLEYPDYAVGGLLRVVTTWTPAGRDNLNAGRFAFTFDHRHKIAGVAPSDLAKQIGYLGNTGAIMTDSKFDVVHLYYAQPLCNGTCGFAFGRMDLNETFYTHSFSSPWTGFMSNEAPNSTSVAQPQSSWGALAAKYLTKTVYVIAGLTDANGTAQDNLDWFSGGSEFWKAVEIGYVPDRETRLDKKISFTIWHVDERKEAQIGDGQGALLTASWLFGNYNPFFRIGFSEGTAPVFNKSFLCGFRKKVRNQADWMGIAFSIGDSSTDLGTQSMTELFYSYYFAKDLALTGDLQFIQNPLNNEKHDSVTLASVRLRFTF